MDEAQLKSLLLQNFHFALQISKIGAAAFLGFGLLAQALALIRPSSQRSQMPRFWRLCYLVGALSLASQITLLFIVPGSPLQMMVLLGIGLALIAMALVSESDKADMRALQFLACCAAWFLAVGGSYAVNWSVNPQKLELPGLTAFHVTTATLSSAMCIGALLSSVTYLASFQLLKRKKLGEKLPLPSLQSLDSLTERTLLLGLFFMTISLISGLGLVMDTATLVEVSTFKFVWAFGVWGYYALVIFGRAFWNWKAKKGALLSVWGAVFVLITLFGTLLGTRS